ncbi:unnamed protein product [Enterobius vermicularis]|uniref:SWIB domain-containing protein n=1 Tax=Enterobius vermicularis TaxID=51028 RepID=A0A0N4VIY3_ENTVE|nr:unnamed protein product [Enterobius vermicularis]
MCGFVRAYVPASDEFPNENEHAPHMVSGLIRKYLITNKSVSELHAQYSFLELTKLCNCQINSHSVTIDTKIMAQRASGRDDEY